MDAEKRKRDDAGELEGKKAKLEAEVTEEEVEEFFAILRRIHVAAKQFGKTDGAGRKLTAAMKWRPSFEVEDFEEDNGSLMKEQTGGEEKAEADSGLDLNSHPV